MTIPSVVNAMGVTSRAQFCRPRFRLYTHSLIVDIAGVGCLCRSVYNHAHVSLFFLFARIHYSLWPAGCGISWHGEGEMLQSLLRTSSIDHQSCSLFLLFASRASQISSSTASLSPSFHSHCSIESISQKKMYSIGYLFSWQPMLLLSSYVLQSPVG